MSIDLHDPQQYEDHDPEHNPAKFLAVSESATIPQLVIILVVEIFDT